MREDVVTKIQVGADILLIGDVGSLHGFPRDLRRRSGACGVLRRMLPDAQAMRQLRRYWASRSVSQPMNLRSDHELLEAVEAAIENGSVQAMVLPDHGPHIRDHGTTPSGTQTRAVGFRPHSTAVPVAPIVSTAVQGGPTRLVKPATSRPVSQMTTEERIWEVVKRAAALLPQATGAALMGLFTPENIAIAAGLALLSAAANLTPLGWAADTVILAIAFGFGGMAAIQGLKDLVTCFRLTANAQSERHLDQAGELLAKVVADLGVAWLMAILHERVKRGKAGGGGVDESAGQSTRGTKRDRQDVGSGSGGRQTSPRKRRAVDQDENAAGQKKPASDDQSSSSSGKDGGSDPKAKKKTQSKRDRFLGDTPGKNSRTGREVRERMRKEKTLRTNPRTKKDEFLAENGKWYPVDSPQTHMGHHPEDAVDWWNREGREYGAKSPEVRAWMLDSKNYRFEYGPLNSARGRATASRYLPPLK